MILAKGTVVGKYRLEAPLAQGGMGAVWTARHVKLERQVAVKFLAPLLAGSRLSLARFEREAHAAASIQSPHVVGVEDFGVEGDTPYIVMELLRGEDLGARLKRVTRLPLADAAWILVQVGKGLRHAHAAGIVHRDLKPSNLFLAQVEDDEVVKILDFGIAKEPDTPVPEQTDPGTLLGSPNYVSPEQAASDKTIDHRSDLWSLAVVLYQMVTGVLPFGGHTMGNVLKKVFMMPPPKLSEVAPDLPAELEEFFRRALAKRRNERFQDIGEMVRAFVTIAAPEQEMPLSSRRVPFCDKTMESPKAPAPPAAAVVAISAAEPEVAPTVKQDRARLLAEAAPAEPPAGWSDPGSKTSMTGRGRKARRALPLLLLAAVLGAGAAALSLRTTLPTAEVRPSAALLASGQGLASRAAGAAPDAPQPAQPSIALPSREAEAAGPAAAPAPPSAAPRVHAAAPPRVGPSVTGPSAGLTGANAGRRPVEGRPASAPEVDIAPPAPNVDNVSPEQERTPAPQEPPSTAAAKAAAPDVAPSPATPAGTFDKRWF